MINEGKHVARGVEGALTQSKEKGTPGVQVILEVTEGEHAGTRIRWDGWLTEGGEGKEGTAQRTLESLRYLGWQGEFLTDLTGIDSNLVQIVVEHEERDINGEIKTFPRVRWVNRLGGGAKISDEARMPEASAKALAQRFRAMARGVPVVQGGKPAATKPGTGQKPVATKPRTSADTDPLAGADFGDDNIPFATPFTTEI